MTEELYGTRSYIEHFRSGGSGTIVNDTLLSQESRLRKARKIRAVLSDFFSRPLSEMSALDIGCSGGHITHALSDDFASMVGIDTDAPALQIARALGQRSRLSFEQGSATALPFTDESFDVVICNHVYEHVAGQVRMFREIRRVLRRGGICYLGAGNRFALIEPHYRLPFLSWPPKAISHMYLRLARRGEHYLENHLHYWGLRRLVKDFRVHEYTAKILANPARFSGGDPTYDRLPTRWLPERVLRLANPIIPTYVWLLERA